MADLQSALDFHLSQQQGLAALEQQLQQLGVGQSVHQSRRPVALVRLLGKGG
jgi:hypothetical protein